MCKEDIRMLEILARQQDTGSYCHGLFATPRGLSITPIGGGGFGELVAHQSETADAHWRFSWACRLIAPPRIAALNADPLAGPYFYFQILGTTRVGDHQTLISP